MTTVDKSGGRRICGTCGEWSYGCAGQCKPPAPVSVEPPSSPAEPGAPGEFRFTVEPLASGSATYGRRRVR